VQECLKTSVNTCKSTLYEVKWRNRRMENRQAQFVIQEHSRQDEPVHWDLMLDAGEVLRTYRLDLPPENVAGQICTATKIHDHPLRFLTYEGSVNKGLGSVKLVDSGTYRLIEDGLESFRLDFNGEILRGEFSLARTKDDTWEFRPYPNAENSQR
jgi:hypothetical protein